MIECEVVYRDLTFYSLSIKCYTYISDHRDTDTDEKHHYANSNRTHQQYRNYSSSHPITERAKPKDLLLYNDNP